VGGHEHRLTKVTERGTVEKHQGPGQMMVVVAIASSMHLEIWQICYGEEFNSS
jgi:hypothetical protein